MQTFEIEQQAFESARMQLVAGSAGKYVVIAGTTISRPFDAYEQALSWAYAEYGLNGFCVKQVVADEPVLHFSRHLGLCGA